MVFQPGLEEKLRTHFAQKDKVQFYEGCEVTKISSDKEGAELLATSGDDIIQIRSKYIIGCDGRKSLMRKWMNVSLDNLKFDQSWMVVDSFLKQETDTKLLPSLHQQICAPKRPTTYVPGVGLHRRFEFMLVDGDTAEGISEPSSINRLIAAHIDPEKLNIARNAVYTFHELIAKTWRKDRFFLSGDRAHQMPPFAGQGMCSGIRDAHNLVFKLSMVIKGTADATLLDTYELERKPHVTAMSKGAIHIGKMIQTNNRLVMMLRNFQFRLARNSQFIHDKLRDSSLKKLPYKKGLLANNHKLSSRLSIQPLVQVNGESLLLDELLGNQFALISKVTIDNKPWQEWMETFNCKTLVIGQDFNSAHYSEWMLNHKVDFVIVRPDRYIYSAGKSKDVTNIIPLLRPLNN